MTAGISWRERLYWKTRAALVPDLQNSQYAYAERLRIALSSAERWLDVGCGHGWFPRYVADATPPLDLAGRLSVGIDPDRSALARHEGETLKVNGAAEALPFTSGSFDLVTANMVLEHIAEPAPLFGEVGRVLTRDGMFLVHTPNAEGYTTALTKMVPPRMRPAIAGWLDGRRRADIFPTFYRANTTAALDALARGAGMRVERADFVQTSAQLIAIPPLMLAEMLVIRALQNPSLARRRACLIVAFRKI